MSAAVLLVNPKAPRNVGGIIRTLSCYGVDQLRYTGERMDRAFDRMTRIPREERMKGYSEVTWRRNDRAFDEFKGFTPVAVEVREDSEMLQHFEHPEAALYVFGPEDASLERVHTIHCQRFVAIPTAHCLNLAVAVSTVLYDRHVKLNPDSRMDMAMTEQRGHFDRIKEVFESGGNS